MVTKFVIEPTNRRVIAVAEGKPPGKTRYYSVKQLDRTHWSSDHLETHCQ